MGDALSIQVFMQVVLKKFVGRPVLLKAIQAILSLWGFLMTMRPVLLPRMGTAGSLAAGPLVL